MRGRTAEYPEMERQLFLEFEEMRQAGKPVKRWSFVRRTKQILNEKNPDHEFRFVWFERFQKRYNISLGRKTHYLSRLQSGGDYQDGDIANMHQTPLSFLLDDEKTFDIKGVKEVWEQSGQSGLDKRQATVPLMVLIGFDLQSSLREKVFESLQRKKSQTTNA